MDETSRQPQPPPDPGKLTLQVVVDVVSLILSAAVAFAVATWLFGLRLPGDVGSEILFSALALAAAIIVILLGVGVRAWVRGLFGVADTAPGEEPEAGAPMPPDAEDDDLSEPTVCLKCGCRIPAGMAQCPNCGWTYRQ